MHAGDNPALAKGSDVVVITGGTSGVGRATAQRFAKDGARVAVLARGSEALAATVREIQELGGRGLAIEVDVADAQQVFDAADHVEHELGPIDIWINNAMTTVFGPVHAIEPHEYRRVTDVTYHGFVWGTQAALNKMRPRNRGTIVQVGSALAYRAIPLQAAYCGAKHAIRAFTDALRCELIHEHSQIQVTMVHLPGVNTPQFHHCLNKLEYEPQPVPPIFQPEITAAAIHRAAYHHRREVYVGHPTVETIVGNKLAPGWLDSFLAYAAWQGQLTNQRAPPEQPNNLFEPTPGQGRARGDFDERARERDLVTDVTVPLGAAGVRFLLLLIWPLWGPVVVLHRLASLARARRAAST